MSEIKSIIKLLRPKQWIKNFFVFAALLFSNKFTDINLIKNNIFAFICFCLISSTVYVLNDIVDVERDRKHPKKCKRPIASGEVSVLKALMVGIILALISIVCSMYLNKILAIIIILYLINNLLYSFKVKNVILLDVFSIAVGFVLRVLAGGIVTGVKTSNWLILCTLFLALFLGFGKRRNEVIILGGDAKSHREILNKYSEKMLDQLINIVITCTIVFYSIYCVLGSNFENFVWTTFLVVFGVLRYYYLMYSKCEGGSPTELVLRDKGLIYCVGLWVCSCIIILNV